MIPPAAAPPKAPMPAPFSRVLKSPPAHPAMAVRVKTTATIVNVRFIVPPKAMGIETSKLGNSSKSAFPQQGTINFPAAISVILNSLDADCALLLMPCGAVDIVDLIGLKFLRKDFCGKFD